MTTHELARVLLKLPDLPVATYANGETYMSMTDRASHGLLKLARLHTYGGDHLVLGNLSRRDINGPNWYITDTYGCRLPDQWNDGDRTTWTFGQKPPIYVGSGESYEGPTREPLLALFRRNR